MLVGFTCGAFDLFHAGHNIFLRDCKTRCDKLIVGLHTNPTIDRPEKNIPIQTTFERYTQLINCKWVDEVIPYDTEKDLYNIIATTYIDIRFVGADYRDNTITAQKLCEKLGIQIQYMSRDHDFSSSELRKRLSDDSISIKPLVYFQPSKSSLF
jgi:glycerol-3-phosphate cytidylyltransferase